MSTPRPDLRLKSQRFREERAHDWKRLESLLSRIETSSARSLSADELVALPALYRTTLSALSVARSISLDQDLEAYLDNLCGRAYVVIYGSHSPLHRRVWRFFAQDWPLSVQRMRVELLISLAVLVIGMAVGFWLFQLDSAWFNSFVGEALAGERGPTSTRAELRATLYNEEEHAASLTAFSISLFTHNTSVAFFCIALGFALGIPTLMLIFSNGCMLGLFIALFASRGLTFEFLGWVSIHGTTELFAIILAGAAGLVMARSVTFPGVLSRIDAARKSAETIGPVAIGVMIMLTIAGFLEGIGRQTLSIDLVRYGIGTAMLMLWLSYFYLRRRPRSLVSGETGL
ncbi:MAG: stage II sporulation protein M [Asticcacaulis sp.]